jgi:hypothetical protein
VEPLEIQTQVVGKMLCTHLDEQVFCRRKSHKKCLISLGIVLLVMSRFFYAEMNSAEERYLHS